MQEYTTKVDWWIATLLVGSLLFCIAFGIYLLLTRDPLLGTVSMAIGLFMTTLIILIGIPCKYILDDDRLVVRSGRLTHIIPYADITDIVKTRSPLSAPAFSLRRIKIEHRKGFILISPKNRDSFIAELKARLG